MHLCMIAKMEYTSYLGLTSFNKMNFSHILAIDNSTGSNAKVEKIPKKTTTH